MRVPRTMITLIVLLGGTSWSPAQAQQAASPVSVDAARAAEVRERVQASLLEALGFDPATPPATAREVQGSVTGLVTAEGTGRPLTSAQVFLPGTGFGSLTNDTGRFLLLNIPVGEYTLRVELIGYAGISQQVTVSEGEVSTVNVQLSEEALALDELIVTGTAGQARRREIGNSIAVVRVAGIAEPVQSVDNLLQARAPGVWISSESGGSGSGARIRFRGNTSATMSNAPLIYVDGIRVKSEPYPEGPSGPSTRSSPLNDISPTDIDRIEIIKGAAATTLYGTEAAAGVIQIFTKRGGTGTAQWTAQIDQGVNYIRPWGPDIGGCQVPGGGVINCKYMFQDPILRNGHRQRYSLSVRGGQEQLGYFMSGNFVDSDGGVETDDEKRFGFRGNATFTPNPQLTIDFSSSLTSAEINNTRQGNTGTSTVMVANQQYWGPNSRSPETLREMLRRHVSHELNRFTTGITAHYQPLDNLTNRLTVGYDVAEFNATHIIPYQWRRDNILGSLDRMLNETKTSSFDYVTTLSLGLTSELRGAFSAGAQLVEHEELTITAEGDDFPGPGDYTVSSTARRDAEEERLRVITGGFFAQALFDFRDRYFLTIGTRVDGNSAFGQSFGLQLYPKASFSYVISDESFWRESLGEVKLRAAYGFAGRAPGAFDAVRTWDPIGLGADAPALAPANLGNPEMGPERTAELEVGIDGSFLGGRLDIEYTYYTQTTTDALFAVRAPPSEGGWSAQLQNVGEMTNSGHEVQVGGTLIDRRSLRWTVGLGLATNHSKATDLGGAPRFSVGEDGFIQEGQPVPVIINDRVTNFWAKAKPIYEEDAIYGPHYPTLSLSPNMSITLPGDLRISARGEYHGGWWIRNTQERVALSRLLDFPTCYAAYEKRDEGRMEDLLAWEWYKCIENVGFRPFVDPGDFFELREVTVDMPLGRWLSQFNQVHLSVSARNLFYWTKPEQQVGHPEAGDAGRNQGPGAERIVREIAEQIPPSSSIVASIRVIF